LISLNAYIKRKILTNGVITTIKAKEIKDWKTPRTSPIELKFGVW
jgi:hypothetical protein